MSNSTPRAALPPLPEPSGYVTAVEEGKVLHLPRTSLGGGLRPLYTAEQMQERDRQVVEHVIRACAAIAAETVVAEFEGVYHYGENAEAAILALLEEPKE